MKSFTANWALLLALAVAPPGFGQDFQERHTFQVPNGGITRLSVSSDGKTLAFADRKHHRIYLRTVGTGKQVELGEQSAPVLSLAFSADGSKLAVLTQNKVVKLWDLTSNQVIAQYQNLAATGVVAITADGKVVLAHAVGGFEKKEGRGTDWVEIRLLEVASGKQRTLLRDETPEGIPGISANLTPLSFSPDGRMLAVGTSDVGGRYTVIAVDTRTGKQQRLSADMAAVLTCSMDGKTLVSSERFQTPVGNPPKQPVILHSLKFWNVATGTVRTQCQAIPDLVAIAANLRTAITVDPSGVVKVWETPVSGLELRLTTRKVVHKLDLGGKPPEEFLRLFAQAKADKKGFILFNFTTKLPPCPTVDLVLEIRNTSDHDIDFWTGGDYGPPFGLDVEGPGVHHFLCQSGLFMAPRPPLQPAGKITLAPGKSHSVTIKELAEPISFARMDGQRFYWTNPGDCTVKATWALAAGPEKRGGPVLVSNSVQIRVALPKITPARLKGLKDAVADIEKGQLKLKEYPLPALPWFPHYLGLLQKECRIDWVTVDPREVVQDPHHPRMEIDGYNGVMGVEIERRFGKGILNQLRERAQADFAAGKPVATAPKTSETDRIIHKNEPEESKAARARLAGMRAALADIVKGILQTRSFPLPSPPWYEDYAGLVKSECGVELVFVNSDAASSLPEMHGYNALMFLEIEHRFGRDILGRLANRAMNDYFQARKSGR